MTSNTRSSCRLSSVLTTYLAIFDEIMVFIGSRCATPTRRATAESIDHGADAIPTSVKVVRHELNQSVSALHDASRSISKSSATRVTAIDALGEAERGAQAALNCSSKSSGSAQRATVEAFSTS